MKTTNLENQMIINIAESQWNEMNGCGITTSDETVGWYYSEDLTTGMNIDQVKGVVTSLVKKGLAVVQEDEEDNMIWLTDKGVEIYLSA